PPAGLLEAHPLVLLLRDPGADRALTLLDGALTEHAAALRLGSRGRDEQARSQEDGCQGCGHGSSGHLITLLGPVTSPPSSPARIPTSSRLSCQGGVPTRAGSSASDASITTSGGSGRDEDRPPTRAARRPAPSAPSASSTGPSPTWSASPARTSSAARAARKIAGSGFALPARDDTITASTRGRSSSPSRTRASPPAAFDPTARRRPRARRSASTPGASGSTRQAAALA